MNSTMSGWEAQELSSGSATTRASAASQRTSLARTDGAGNPPAVTLTAGHRNDITQLLPLLDAVGPLADKVGRPRKRPNRVIADRGYDRDKHRREVWRRGVKPVIARRRTEHGSRLGRERWGATAGSSSAPSRGCTSSEGSASAASATPTSTSPSCTSPAPSSAGGDRSSF